MTQHHHKGPLLDAQVHAPQGKHHVPLLISGIGVFQIFRFDHRCHGLFSLFMKIALQVKSLHKSRSQPAQQPCQSIAAENTQRIQ